jgi:hypothetical protein
LAPENAVHWSRCGAGQDTQIFHDVYGDYDVAYGGARWTGGPATARLTYRDKTGHFYAATISGPVVPGSPPQTYTGGCDHWTTGGTRTGDLSSCGWSGRVGGT